MLVSFGVYAAEGGVRHQLVLGAQIPFAGLELGGDERGSGVSAISIGSTAFCADVGVVVKRSMISGGAVFGSFASSRWLSSKVARGGSSDRKYGAMRDGAEAGTVEELRGFGDGWLMAGTQ